jgi:hypothetical protein
MSNTSDKLREIVDKTFPLFGSRLDEWRKVERDNLLSDLTALISEHYYPKEFVRWMFQGCPFIIGENGAGNIIAFSVRDGKQFTFDELFNYWKENEQ